MKQYRHRRTANPSHVFPTLEPGELSVNTANRQLAVGDANVVGVGTPLPLLAVRYFDVRGIYAVGDHVVQAGVLYRCIVAHGPAAFDPAHFGAAAGSGGGGLTISDTPPGTPTDGMLWWESDTGKLYVRYNDGVGAAQWVEAVAVPQIDTSSFTTKTYVDAADALKVAKAGDTMTGDLTITRPTSAFINLDKQVNSGQRAAVVGSMNGLNRWRISLGTGTAESGSNVGSDLTITSYNDAGAPTSDCLAINRATFLTTLSGDLTVTKASPGINLNKAGGNSAFINGMQGTSPRWGIVPGNNTTESGGNSGSDFLLARYDDAGVYIDNPIFIPRSTGLIEVKANPTAPLGVATKQYVDAGVRAINYLNTTAYTFILSDTGKLVLLNNTGNLAQSATVPPNSAVAFPLGAQIDLIVTATNVVTTIVPGAGVTIWSEGSKRKLPMSGSGATLIKVAQDFWTLNGSLIA